MKRFWFYLLVICTFISYIVPAHADFEVPWKKEVSMPYSTQEYREMGWSVEELVNHFEELGFSEIKLDLIETFDETRAGNYLVNIEDTSANSWFTEYRKFEKGEVIRPSLKICISGYKVVPTLTVDNCDDFANLVNMDSDSSERSELIASFMQAHNGEYIEFDGLIIEWYDEWFWNSVSLTIAVEGSEQTNFSWDTISLSDLGMTGNYHYNEYRVGLISEGMKTHVIAKIDWADNTWSLKIDSIEIIE